MDESLKTKGLLKKYIIKKADKSPVEPQAEYFVLRLDPYGDDIKHMEACRAAILTYADKIAFHLPTLAAEIIDKYHTRYNGYDPKGLEYLRKVIKDHEKTLHYSYGGDEGQRVHHILDHYQRKAAEGIAERKEIVEKAISQFLALRLAVEMIGLADTHAEKASRLRGFIQILDVTIERLRKEDLNGIENHWPYFDFGSRSDYPYREILSKFDRVKQENADLKKRLAEYQTPEA